MDFICGVIDKSLKIFAMSIYDIEIVVSIPIRREGNIFNGSSLCYNSYGKQNTTQQRHRPLT